MAINHLPITLIVDNKADSNLTAEHGLAMWIDTADRHILFDTGQGARPGRQCRQTGDRFGAGRHHCAEPRPL